jgi:UDP-glucose 4-epimerase
MKKKCIVTGGAGFIGSHLTDRLLSEGHSVCVIDNLCGGWMKNLREAEKSPHFTFIHADIRDAKAIRPHFDGVDWVFHLAALADIVPSIEKPREYFETNVDGTFNVLEAAKIAHVKRFLYAASSSCYGISGIYPTPEDAPAAPQYPYALTKYLGEQLVLHWATVYKLPPIIQRLWPKIKDHRSVWRCIWCISRTKA